MPAAFAAARIASLPAWQPWPSSRVAARLTISAEAGTDACALWSAEAGLSRRARRSAMSRVTAMRLDLVVDDFEGRLRHRGGAAHVLEGGGLQHHVAADGLAGEQAEQGVLAQGPGLVRAGFRDVRREVGEQRAPAPVGLADDLVIRALAANVLVGRDRGEDRDADRLREGLRLAGAVVLVDDEAADAAIAPRLV